MSAEVIVMFLAGLLQPFLQEFLLGRKVDGRAAVLITAAISFVLALSATWVTGGLAGGVVPAFSLADPSPLLAFLVAKFTPVYAISQIVFGLFSREVHSAAGTASTP